MSSSSSEARAAAQAPTPRLVAALAASAALHLALAGALDRVAGGPPAGVLSALPPAAPVLRAVLRPVAGQAADLPAYVPPVDLAPAAAPAATAQAGGGAPGASPDANPLMPPRYYSARELDVRPGILTRIEPEYPLEAARRFLSGRVVAKLLIGETGLVQDVLIVEAEPPGYFEAAARKAFAAARFTPAMKDGRPVRAQLVLEILFEGPPPPLPPRRVES